MHFADKSNESSTKVLFIDNIRVGDLADRDLSVAVTADKEVMRSETTNIHVKVSNLGDKSINAYQLLLIVNGKEISRQQINDPLSSLDTKTFEIYLIK